MRWPAPVLVFSALVLMLGTCAAGTIPYGAPARHVSDRELTMEKTGRVVDADTGAAFRG